GASAFWYAIPGRPARAPREMPASRLRQERCCFFSTATISSTPSILLPFWKRWLLQAFRFVKTHVHITDSIHADWVKPINASLVINFCVRRLCHDMVGGFPDLILCRREGGKLLPETDIFFKFEDMYYNLLITRLFQGVQAPHETVEYMRYPGNSFD